MIISRVISTTVFDTYCKVLTWTTLYMRASSFRDPLLSSKSWATCKRTFRSKSKSLSTVSWGHCDKECELSTQTRFGTFYSLERHGCETDRIWIFDPNQLQNLLLSSTAWILDRMWIVWPDNARCLMSTLNVCLIYPCPNSIRCFIAPIQLGLIESDASLPQFNWVWLNQMLRACTSSHSLPILTI